jgi:hypothetical protein
MERMERIARAVALVTLALHAALCAYVIGSRIGFAGQIEWMTGSVLDHVERVSDGQPVYTAPGQWIAYIYPPLYYWVGAAFGGTALACRLISVTSALVQAMLAFRIAEALGATRKHAIVAIGLFFVAFSYVGWWYDIERADTLFGAMMLAVCALVLDAKKTWTFAVAGALCGLGFFAKQQAVFYLAGAAAGIFAAMRASEPTKRIDTYAFVGAALAVLAPLGLWQNATSGTWFGYYVVKMPRSHGIMWALAPDVFVHDILLGAGFVAATILVVLLAARALREGGGDRRLIIFGAMLLFGFGAAISSRLHIGGWINVLQPWTSFAAIAAAVLVSRAKGRLAPIAYGAIVVQCLLAGYDPRAYVPRPGMAAATAKFHDYIRDLQGEDGDVLCVSQGHLTRDRHFQMSALADVVRVEGHSPPDLLRSLRHGNYYAILDDARLKGDTPMPNWPPVMLEDVDDLRAPLFAHYYVAERLDDAWVTLPMIAPAMPRWVLLRRTTPLDEQAPDLAARHLREMGLAERRAAALRDGKTPEFAREDIETLAARE